MHRYSTPEGAGYRRYRALVLVGCGKASTATANSVPGSIAGAGDAATGPGGAAAAPTTGGGATCPTSNTTNFANPKFVLHVGLAAGTSHRYLYEPFKAGTFHKGAAGRVRGLIEGGATALSTNTNCGWR